MSGIKRMLGIGGEKGLRSVKGPSRPGLPSDPQKRRRLLAILLIAAAAATVIAVEIVLWGGGSQPAPPPANATNQTINQTDNQTVTANQTPEAPRPDLDVREMSVTPRELPVGENLTVAVTIKNKGETNATNVTVAFLIGEEVFESLEIGSLSGGETTELSAVWAPQSSHVGERAVRVRLDPEDEIEEENEENNEGAEAVTVEERVIRDISGNFTHQSTANFNILWYSENFRTPPESGEHYQYFQLTRQTSETYYLDVVIAGFRATRQNQVYGIEIPDASASGWNGRRCVKETLDSDTCIWNGPQIRLDLDFDGSRLEVRDQSGEKARATTSGNSVEGISLAGIKTADWPEEEIKTWRGYNAPEPDRMIPREFYEVADDSIYVHPMKWNPRSLDAQVATWLRFKITVD